LKAIVITVALLIASAGCYDQHPSSVPEGATRVSFSKDGGWVHCWLDTSMEVNRCRTYNASGERLYRIGKKNDDDDVFLKYEGSGPVPDRDLQIDIIHTEPDFIWLRNGVVLLPRNDYDHQKSVVDEINKIGGNSAKK